MVVLCDVCGKMLLWKSDLIRHQRTHTADKPFECLECGTHFSQAGHLKIHVQTVHLGIKRFTCEHCNTNFTYASGLKKHVQTVHLKEPIPCSFCNKVFGEQRNLKRHIKAIHQDNVTATVFTTQVDTVTDDQDDESTQKDNRAEEYGVCSDPIYAFNLLIKREEEEDFDIG